jgi:hypothetical protein
MRTDVHAPTNFDPQHYSYVGLIYIGQLPEDAWGGEFDDEQAREFIDTHKHVGVHGLGQCDHCGAYHVYCQIFEYDGPGEHGWISVGNDCARGRFQVPDRATFELATMRRKVASAREYGKKSAAVRAVLEANPQLADALEWVREARATLDALANEKAAIINRGDEDTPEYASACREHNTLGRLIGWNINTIEDISSKLFRFGSVSDKQIAFVSKLATEGAAKQADAKRVAEVIAAMKPLPAGRQLLEGTVKGIKVYDGAYGVQHKVILSLDSGHTVFGTCPISLTEALGEILGRRGGIAQYDDLRGCRISFTASVDPSKGDNDFATFKRPAAPKLEDATAALERQAKIDAENDLRRAEIEAYAEEYRRQDEAGRERLLAHLMA